MLVASVCVWYVSQCFNNEAHLKNTLKYYDTKNLGQTQNTGDAIAQEIKIINKRCITYCFLNQYSHRNYTN